jgi:hypothetical protein
MNAVVKHEVDVLPAPVQPTPANMLEIISRAASDPAIDVAKVEKLLELHERLVAREARTAYAAALAKLQPKLPLLSERGGIKDRSGNVQSRYALWEDVVEVITPILSEHGFSLSFRTRSDDKSVTVTGVLAHERGHSEQTELTLPFDTSGSKNSVQSVGSSTSYGKRYTAAALLNLRSGEVDDDGQRGGITCITANQAADLRALASEVGADIPRFLKYIGAEDFEKIPAAKFDDAVAALKRKGGK